MLAGYTVVVLFILYFVSHLYFQLWRVLYMSFLSYFLCRLVEGGAGAAVRRSLIRLWCIESSNTGAHFNTQTPTTRYTDGEREIDVSDVRFHLDECSNKQHPVLRV